MSLYLRDNPKCKQAAKALLANALAEGKPGLACFQPGPFGTLVVPDGKHAAEGPHYPEPHRWYAQVTVRGGHVVTIK